MTSNRSIEFFDSQFRKQVDGRDYALNPFEAAALPFVRGRVLDLGCGLGNLSLQAARRGCAVTAIDASPAAVARIRAAAAEENLDVTALQARIEGYLVSPGYDSIVAIGLLMFFPCAEAARLLDGIRGALAPGGRAVVNTLVEGTPWTEPFEPERFCLLPQGELERRFAGWTILLARQDDFPAPGGKLKRFDTVIAQKP